jgi:hypothetical protein
VVVVYFRSVLFCSVQCERESETSFLSNDGMRTKRSRETSAGKGELRLPKGAVSFVRMEWSGDDEFKLRLPIWNVPIAYWFSVVLHAVCT